jgi:hypothetical protein
MIKRFLVPVLALAAFGLPAMADVVTYCSGSGCNPENATAFTSDLATDNYTLQGLTTFASANLAGSTYTDPLSQILFTDFLGNSFTVTSGILSTPVVATGSNEVVITIPSTVTAIELTVNVPKGLCLDAYCPANETTGFVGFINTNPGAQWTVELGPLSAGSNISIDDFTVATAATASQASTPEIGTLLLIGAGLIAMRWMKRVPRRLFRTPLPA